MDYMTHIIPVLSEPEEKTLDPVYSIALSSDSVPIVSVKQTKAGSQGQWTDCPSIRKLVR